MGLPRNGIVCVTLALAAGLCAGDALAFEQKLAPGSDAAQPIAPGLEIKPSSSDRGTGLQLMVPGTTDGDSNGNKGALPVPGIGSLGVLPKLDFGLEMLYGSSEQATPDQQPTDKLPDSLILHGSVKKTF